MRAAIALALVCAVSLAAAQPIDQAAMMREHAEMLKEYAQAPAASKKMCGGGVCMAHSGRKLAQLYAGPLPPGTNPFSFVFGPGGSVWSPITGGGGGGPYFGPYYNPATTAPAPTKQVSPLAPAPAPPRGGAAAAPAPAPSHMMMAPAPAPSQPMAAAPTVAPKPVPV